MVYVRGERKSHGQKNLIEGGTVDGRRIILIEDSLTTGGSVLRAVEAIRESGGMVEGVLAVYGYAFDDTARAFSEAGVPLATLTNYPTVVDVAQRLGLVKSEDVDRLREWRSNPWEFKS
jgi:orotate phosphoribosyltransferase